MCAGKPLTKEKRSWKQTTVQIPVKAQKLLPNTGLSQLIQQFGSFLTQHTKCRYIFAKHVADQSVPFLKYRDQIIHHRIQNSRFRQILLLAPATKAKARTEQLRPQHFHHRKH